MPHLVITLNTASHLYADGRFNEEVAIIAKRAAEEQQSGEIDRGNLLRSSTGAVVGHWTVEE